MGRGPPRAAVSRPRSSWPCSAASRCRVTAFSSSSSASSCADPMCSICRALRWWECTICTAMAPDEFFTVRAYGTRQPYGRPPGLVRPARTNPQVRRLQQQRIRNADKSQVSGAGAEARPGRCGILRAANACGRSRPEPGTVGQSRPPEKMRRKNRKTFRASRKIDAAMSGAESRPFDLRSRWKSYMVSPAKITRPRMA